MSLETSGTEKRILFINMYDINAEILEDFLTRWGFSIRRTSMTEAEKALAACSEYSQIVYQFLRFDETEFSVLERIKKLVPMVHFIITAPYYFYRHIEHLKSWGFDCFLIQPYSPSEAKSVIFSCV